MSGSDIGNELQEAYVYGKLTGNIDDDDSDIVKKANSVFMVLKAHKNKTVGDPTMPINDIWNNCQIKPDSREELLEIIKALKDLGLVASRVTNAGYPKRRGILDV